MFQIGYKNLLTDSGATVTASTEATGFEKENAYDGLGFDYWKPTATGDSYLQVTFATTQAVDYVAIWGHDLFDHSSTYKVESSDDGAAWSDVFSAVTPTDNNTIYKSFASETHRWWRVTINSATTLPAIAGIQIGEYLEMPRKAGIGSSMPTLAPEIEMKTARSESGAFIGGRQLSKGVKGSFKFSDIDPAWVRTNWKPFITHMQTPKVFVIQWDTATYTDEVMLAWADGKVSPPSYSNALYMDLSLKFKGAL